VEEAIDKGAEKVTRRLIDLAEIKVGSRVLDIATCLGEPAITANEVGKSSHMSKGE
jgi:predicted methyltransferase